MSEPMSADRPGLRLLSNAKPQSGEWWTWWAWLEGPDDTLDQVEAVRYTLHPSFPDPVRTVTDRQSRFKLEAVGWGEFSLAAAVLFKNGDALSLTRWLSLGSRRGEGAEDRRPRVFASYSTVDWPIVRVLVDRLKMEGIDVTTPESMRSDDWCVDALVDAVQRADIVAVFTRGELRGWAEEEIHVARERGKPIVPVLMSNSDVPGPLADYQAVRMLSQSDIPQVCDAIAARAKGSFYPDEIAGKA